MNEEFNKHVRAAALSAWWTVLVAVVLLLVQSGAYLVVMARRPAWILTLCGPDVTWATLQNLWLNMMVHFKLVIWLMALAALWLTLWSRRLQRD